MPHPIAPQTRRARWPLLALAGVVVAVAGYLALHAWESGAERRAALALAEHVSPGEALPALLASLERHPTDPELLKAVVETEAKAGAPVADVEPFIERWCKASPDDPAAFSTHADALQRLSRFPEAIEAAERAATLSPADDRIRTTLAWLYLTTGRFTDASREYRRLLEAKPGQADLVLALARAEWEVGNQEEATRLTDELLARSPNLPGAHLMRGLIDFRAGNYARALAEFNRVKVESEAERTVVLYYRAQSLTRLGRTEEAKKAHEELALAEDAVRFLSDADQRPGDLALQVRAARTLLAAGQPTQARQLLDAALARLGPSRAALEALASCHDALGRPDLAARARSAAAAAP